MSIDIEHLEECIAEAKRFIAKAEEALNDPAMKESYIYASPRRSAVRRSSMDLTRALAQLRRY